jgi:hypothetical protein
VVSESSCCDFCRTPSDCFFGDQNQLAPYVAREEARSVLDMVASLMRRSRHGINGESASSSSSSLSPLQSMFRVGRTMLDTQNRMPLHLGGMISTIFYEGKLKNHKASTVGRHLVSCDKSNRSQRHISLQ